ncbi:dihydrodipicolinate synthase family protein [Thioalkalivibrio sp. HK1]|uniref:dihydrodipicolinate synthase family protein n=1 Tax=Thioalkalivibrio sp. HK1 TaxID=1469245 RepID=UPI0004700A43|nr:dihydrodipicolinate synthase family protein [Thioalkalivibrio sp. HK1]
MNAENGLPLGASDLASRLRPLDSLPAHGVWSPVLVPLRPDLDIDAPRFIAHAKWLLAQGCHGLAIFGTTGEANSFTVAERMALLESAVKDGIPAVSFMVGSGCCALGDTVALTRHALDLGCRRVLMLPPFYYKNMSDEGLYRSYAQAIERIGSDDLRIFLYHFPKISQIPLTEGLIRRLVEGFPRIIAGVKDSSSDWANTKMLIEAFPGLAIFPGSEIFLLDGLRAGGAGCITATSNINAAGARAIFDAHRAMREDEADERQAQATAIRRAIDRFPGIPAQKWLIARFRKDPVWRSPRPPLLALDDDEGKALLEALSATDFDGSRLALT